MTAAVIGFLARAIAFYRRHGISVMTGNGSTCPIRSLLQYIDS